MKKLNGAVKAALLALTFALIGAGLLLISHKLIGFAVVLFIATFFSIIFGPFLFDD